MGPEVDVAMYPCPTGEARKPGSLDGFLDHIFEPVLSGGFSVSSLPPPRLLCFGAGVWPPLLFLPGSSSDTECLSLQDLEQGWALSSRMKGGGSIGPTQQGYPMGEYRWCLSRASQAQEQG